MIFKNKKQYFIPDLYMQNKDLDFDYLFENFKKLPVIELDSGLKWISEKLNL